MLTGKGKMALAGLAAVAAIAALGSSKKETKSGSGETWHYVFAVHPDIPSVEQFQKLTDTFKYLTTDGTIVDVETQPNTLDVTIRYPGKPHIIPEVNSVMTIGEYSLTLTEKDRVA